MNERRRPVIKIAISQAAFDAIATTLPLGTVAFRPAEREERASDLRGVTTSSASIPAPALRLGMRLRRPVRKW
jgi:hypothetical protein